MASFVFTSTASIFHDARVDAIVQSSRVVLHRERHVWIFPRFGYSVGWHRPCAATVLAGDGDDRRRCPAAFSACAFRIATSNRHFGVFAPHESRTCDETNDGVIPTGGAARRKDAFSTPGDVSRQTDPRQGTR